MINFGDGSLINLVFDTDGTVDLDDRQTLLGCYEGVTFAPPSGPMVNVLTRMHSPELNFTLPYGAL